VLWLALGFAMRDSSKGWPGKDSDHPGAGRGERFRTGVGWSSDAGDFPTTQSPHVSPWARSDQWVGALFSLCRAQPCHCRPGLCGSTCGSV